MDALFHQIEQNQKQYIAELMAAIAQPSLSGTGEGIPEMCRMVSEKLISLGFHVEIFPTKRHPAIIAERKGRSARTILFYNHYDVQPVEPLSDWDSDPFKPEIRNGRLYGRGTDDDKGHLYCRLAAVEALLETYGELPCTVRFLIEGEEEIGSPNLKNILEANREALKADLCLWEFGDVDDEGYSVCYLGYRGFLNIQWDVETNAFAGHSGVWGGIGENAVWRLVWALSTVKSPDEKILIPGFYDGISEITESEHSFTELLPPMKENYQRLLGAKRLVTKELDGADLFIKGNMEPACTISGISGGYEGDGPKPIVPHKAFARTDFRLIKGQHPQDILGKLRAHLDAQGFEDVRLSVMGMLEPSKTPADHPYIQLISDAARSVYGLPQRIYPMCSGSGPAYLFENTLNVPIFNAGIGNPESHLHGPNENIRLQDFINGIKHTAAICCLLGKQE